MRERRLVQMVYAWNEDLSPIKIRRVYNSGGVVGTRRFLSLGQLFQRANAKRQWTNPFKWHAINLMKEEVNFHFIPLFGIGLVPGFRHKFTWRTTSYKLKTTGTYTKTQKGSAYQFATHSSN